MKKGIVTIGLALVSTLLVAFLMKDDDQRGRGRKNESQRLTPERIFEAYNIRYNKEIGETSIIFQLEPTDSVQIECPDCIRYMPNDEQLKGTMTVSLRSIDGVYQLQESDFGEWIKIRSSNGKIGLVFTRDGFGEKNLLVRSLKMWRKTIKPTRDEAGVPARVLDINNLYIDKLLKDATEVQTRMVMNFKSDDQITVGVKGVNGAAPENLVCNQYKEGEEWDKTPLEFGSPFPVPTVDGGKSRFYFEFSHIEGIKGVNTYHIDIDRVPARSTGYLDIVTDTTTGDTLLADTTEKEKDPFEKYLEFLQGDPDFTCTTPESKVEVSVDGRLILGPNRRNKVCIPLELTDECVAAAECIGCDSIWAFWIGAGESIINRYAYKDSIRQLKKTEGLIEGWARSRRYRGMTSSSIFPDVKGEDIYFAILDQADTSAFLNQPFQLADWFGDYTYTLSPARYVPSYSFIMKYNPERPVSLCLCNNNAVTTVPIMFRFQQFLTEPKKAEVAVPQLQ